MATKSAGPTSREIDQLRLRIDQLAEEIRQLRMLIVAKKPRKKKPWWREVEGMFNGDPIFAKVVEEGRKWRESQRPAARSKRASR